MTIFFDYYELQVLCEDQIPAIFALTVGLSLKYNYFRSLTDFKFKCYGLLTVPHALISRQLIYKNKNKEFIVNYKPKFPQSYITDYRFLSFIIPYEHKVQYIKLLSYRAVRDPNPWIPTSYVENLDKLKNNPLLTLTPEKIYFNYEGKTQ